MKRLFLTVSFILVIFTAACSSSNQSAEKSVSVLQEAPVSTTAPPTEEPSVATSLPKEGASVTTAPEPGENLSIAPSSVQQEPEGKPVEIFEYNGLVELLALDPSFIIDVKYATMDNFTGDILYEMPLVLIQKEVGQQLAEVQQFLAAEGYALKIFDIYRPLSVQQKMYDATPQNLKKFVAKPSSNAKHCKGIAVDCTLVDKEGKEIDMPSDYDEFSERAHVNYAGGTENARNNRDFLIRVMKDFGFTVYDNEWWHFTAPDQDGYETLDISFSDFLALKEMLANDAS